MARYSVTVASSPDAVYALVADASARPDWLPELKATSGAPDGLLVTGDRFTGYSQLLGHEFVGSSEVTGAQPGRMLAERVVIGASVTTEWTFEPADGGRSTVVTQRMRIEYPRGPLGPVARWLVGRRVDRLQRAALRRLESLAEATRP